MTIRVARVGTSKTLNTILRNQIRQLDGAGFSIICVCDDDEWTAEIRALGVDVWPIGMGRRPGPLAALRWGTRLYFALRRARPTVVHTHNAFHGIAGRLAARAAGIDVVVHTVHNWWYLEPRSSLRARSFLVLERLGARLSDAVLFINHEDFRRAITEEIVPTSRAHFVGNGIDTQGFARRLDEIDRDRVRAELGLSPTDAAIIMVARLEPPKDHATVLAAFDILAEARADVRLVLAGSGLAANDVRRRVAQSRFGDRVTLAGHLRDVAPLVKAADVAVLASHHEGFGRSLVEAMIGGVPVVASDVVGIRDVVQHGETGWLVPPRDARALATTLLDVLDSPDRNARVTAAAARHAHREFNETRVGAVIARLYAELSRGTTRSAPGEASPRALRRH